MSRSWARFDAWAFRKRNSVSRPSTLLAVLFALGWLVLHPIAATGQVQCFTDIGTWSSGLQDVEDFPFTDTNVLQANEVTSTPGGNQGLGSVLTFEKANTGLTYDFTIETLESGAQLVFDDNEASLDGNVLSVGDAGNQENDDFEIRFSDLDVRAFGFLLIGNDNNPGESLTVYSVSGAQLTPQCPVPTGSLFLGVITDQAIGRIVFDEDSGDDDIGISVSYFGKRPGNVAVQKNASSATSNPGSPLGFDIMVSNTGSVEALGVGVSDVFSAPLSNCSWTCTPPVGGTCAGGGPGDLTDTIDLPAGTNAVYGVTCDTDSSASGSFTNSVTITPPDGFADTNSGDDSDAASYSLVPEADLGLAKDDGVTEVDVGDNVTYTLTVTNNGPNDSTGGSVTDTLPAGFSFVSSDSGCTGGGGSVTCPFSALANGDSVMLNFVANVDPSAASPATNSATVSGNETDNNGANDTATHDITVIAQTDIALSKQATPDPVVAGAQLTYILTVTNNGPSASTGGTVTDTLPNDLTFGSSSDCSAIAGSVTCTFGALGVGASQMLQFITDVDPDASGTVSNSASVSGNEEDPVNGNNTAGTTTEIIRQADLDTTKIDNSGGTVVAGETIDYTINVTNLGPNDVISAVVSDTFPTQLDDVRWTCTASAGSSCDAFGNGNINDAVNLLAGGNVTYSVTADVESDALGDMINQASASNPAGTEDPDPSNNADAVTTEVIRRADLRLAKEDASGGETVPGGTLSYRLVITNDGPSNSSGGTVTDTLPAGTTFRGSASGCTAAGSTVSCDFGGLLRGNQRTLVFTVDVDPTATGTLTNTATVTGLDPDPDGSNNGVSHDTLATPQTDLELDKDGPVTASAGEDITYTLTVTNFGPSSSTGSSITDTLPTGLTFVSGSGCSESGGVVTCNVGGVAPDTSANVSFVATIGSGVTTALFNSAEVTANEEDPVNGNNSSTHRTTLDAQVDLRLEKTGDANVTAGGTLSYTLTVNNLGPADASGGSVRDTLPEGVRFQASVDGCSGVTGAVICPFGSLPAMGSTVLSFLAQVDPDVTLPIHNQAAVEGNEPDPDPSNDSDSFVTTVEAVADLSLAKDDDVAAATPGDTLTYRLTVTNLGPSDSTGGTVTDTLPTGLTFLASADGCSASGASVTCPFGPLAFGDTLDLRFEATISPDATGPLVNNATVTGAEVDPNTGNDDASHSTPLNRQADLALSKDDGVLQAVAGQPLTYTLTVQNLGPSDASGVVDDPLPDGLTFVSSADGCTESGGTVSCPFSDLAADSALDLSFVVDLAPQAEDSIENIATVTASDALDLNLANDGATLLTPVVRQADLALTKSSPQSSAVPGESLTFVLSVENLGPSDSGGGTVIDTLPTGTTFLDSTDGCNESAITAGEVHCPFSALAVGDTVQLTFRTRVDAGQTDPVVNDAVVVGDDLDPVAGNDDDSLTLGLAAEADLAIQKTDGLDVTAPGAQHTYTLTVRNLGPSDDPSVTVNDTLPAILQDVTWSCQASVGSSCTSSGTGDLSDSATLAAGGALVYTVRSTVGGSVGGSLSNTATVAGSVTDPDGSNNSATDTTALETVADLTLSKDDGVSTATPGGQLTYTVRVDNRGPSSVSGATVSDVFPPQIEAVAWTCLADPGASCPAAGSGDLAATVDLPADSGVTFTLQATVASDAVGLLVNTASVTVPMGVIDLDSDNNQATDINTLDPSADLSISKTDGLDTVAPGQSLTYDITVRNLGPGDAAGARVVDLLPDAFLGATWTCAPSAGAVCTAGGSGDLIDTVAIPAGGQLLYQVTGTVDPSLAPGEGGLVNTATVAVPPGLDDPAPTNNSVSDIDSLEGMVDLVLTKTDGVASAVPGDMVTYIVTVQNLGPSDAMGAQVMDSVPQGLSCVWTCASPGGSCLPGQLQGDLLDHPSLPVGATATYTALCQVDEGLTGDVLNEAVVSAPVGSVDITPANNLDQDLTSLIPTADLRVTLSDGVTEAIPGQDVIHYSMSAHNDGPSHVQGARLTDSFPPGLQCVWQCTPGSGASCPVGQQSGDIDFLANLQAGASLLIDVTCQVSGDANGTLSNTFSIGTPTGVMDPNPSNNSASDLDTVLTPTVQVSVQLDDALTSLAPGLPLTYNLTAANGGPSDAVDVGLRWIMPVELENVTWSCDAEAGAACSAVGVGDVLETVQLPAGSRVVYVIEGAVRSDAAAGNLLVEAEATLSLGVVDLQPADNRDDDITELVPQVDLAITKDDGESHTVPGETVEYTLVVSNGGPSDAVSAVVEDLLPDSLMDASWSCSPSPGASCSLSDLGHLVDTVNLPVGGQLVYQLDASVSADAFEQGITLSNTATVVPADGVQDLDGTNNGATDSNDLTPRADVGITKTDGLDSVAPGGELTYVLELINEGPSDLAEVLIEDTFPTELSCSWRCEAFLGAQCGTSGEVTGDLVDSPSLPVDGLLRYIAPCQVATDAVGTLLNVAQVSLPPDYVDLNLSDNQASDATDLVAVADLVMSKSDGRSTASPGDLLTYTLVVSNPFGPSDVAGATVEDIFPNGMECLWSCVGSFGATCTPGQVSGNILDVVSLPTGSQATYTALCQLNDDVSGTLVNGARVSVPAGMVDSNPSNDVAQDTTEILAQSTDLEISWGDGVVEATPGESLTYTALVRQLSGPPGEATVQSLFPTQLDCLWTCQATGAASCAAGQRAGDLVDVVQLRAGASLRYTAICAIDSMARGSLSQSATVQPTDGTDANPSNNTASDVDTVLSPRADVAVSITDGLDAVLPDGELTYTLTVRNVAGPSAATNVGVENLFPASLDCLWTCSLENDPSGTGQCTAGPISGDILDTLTLPAAARAVYNAQCQVSPDASGTLTNTARLLTPSELHDPAPGNNEASDTTSVQLLTDLQVLLDDGVTTAVPGANLSYTLNVRNVDTLFPLGLKGFLFVPSTVVRGLLVRDVLPQGLTCSWTCEPSPGATCDDGPIDGDLLDSVDLPAGGQVTYTADCGIDSSARGILSNAADLVLPVGVVDLDNGNNASQDNTLLTPQADLSLQKTDSVLSAAPGGEVVYQLSAANPSGPSGVQGARLVDLFPPSLQCLWSCQGINGGHCDPGLQPGDVDIQLDLPVGAAAWVEAVCQVSPAASGQLQNTATLHPPEDTEELQALDNTASDLDTQLIPMADLALIKSDGVDVAVPGGSLIYNILATNDGPSAVQGVQLTDDLPDALSCTWTCASLAGASCDPTPPPGDLQTTVDLTVGGSVLFTGQCQIDPQARGYLVNTATLQLPGGAIDPQPDDLQATDDDTLLAPQSDLWLSLSNGTDEAVPGESTTYTLRVEGTGPSSVVGAVVETLELASMSCLWTCQPDAGAGCEPGPQSGPLNTAVDLPSMGGVTFLGQCQVASSALGNLNVGAQVTAPADTEDPVPDNNQAQDVDLLTPVADVSLSKDDGETEVAPGDTLTYTLVAQNAGPSDAQVTVSVPVPSPLDCTWSCQPGPGATCDTETTNGDLLDLAHLPTGSLITYSAVCQVDDNAQGSLVNTAAVLVESPAADPQTANNQATDTTDLAPRADVRIQKDDGQTSVSPGDSLTYQIVVTNGGPSPADSVLVQDLFPADLDCTWSCDLPAGCPGTATTGDIDLQISLEADQQVTFTAQCQVSVDATQDIVNTATATVPEGLDPDDTNNTSTDSDVLLGVADLSVMLVDEPDPVSAGEVLAYGVQVTNLGPSSEPNVLLDVLLPNTVTFLGLGQEGPGSLFLDGFESGDTSRWDAAVPTPKTEGSQTSLGGGVSCTSEGVDLSCSLAALASQGSREVVLLVEVHEDANGTLITTVAVHGDQQDPDSSNNSASALTTVEAGGQTP